MAVSQQINAVGRGIKKKKGTLYAPMVQEQARQGIATQSVLARKNEEAADKAEAFQEEQFNFQKQQADAQNQQWQQNYSLDQQAQQNQTNQWNAQNSARKKMDTWNMITGGLSTAASIFDAFGGMDWLSSIS